MEMVVSLLKENSAVIAFVGAIGLYFALQLWILPAMGVPT